MTFKYTNCTTCICSNNLDLIEQTITHIFKREGFLRIPQPPLPKKSLPLIKNLRSQPWLMKGTLLVIGLFVGNKGWTIINTPTPELFCQRAKLSRRPRLSELAIQTGCDAFHLSVHELCWGALLEVNRRGQIFASGYLDCSDIENMGFFQEKIVVQTIRPNFFLLNVSEEIRKATEASFEQLQKLPNNIDLEYDDLPYDFEIVDRVLGLLLVNSNENFWNYWFHGNQILYKVYAEPEKLEADGVRLLFFQVGNFHLRPDTVEIWKPITKQKNYGIELNINDIPF